MKIKYKSILFLFIVSLVLISLSLSAEANLSSIYESPAATEGSSAVKPTAPAPVANKPAPTAKAVTVTTIKTDTVKPPVSVTASPSTEVTVTYRKDLTAKQLEIIKKEHYTYCNAFIDAEMGLRYFYKLQYDAMYKGAKAPTEDELKAMRFELSLLMKDLGSSAKRYASNIRMAQMAMIDMEEEEKSFFAKALGQILGTPAYAVDAGSLNGIAAGLNGIANSTTDVGLSTAADYSRAAQSKSTADAWMMASAVFTAGEVIYSGVSLVTTTALAGTAIVAGAALTMGAATTGAAVVGGVVFVGAVVGGGLETVDAAIGLLESLGSQVSDTKLLKKMSLAVNILNVAATYKKTELIKAGFDFVEGTKDEWIPTMFRETEKPNCPGTNGINKIKKAKKEASSSGGGGGGGGG